MALRLKKEETMRTILVDTPKGKRVHGYIFHKKDGSSYFYRQVQESNDLMRIFDAWSINPQAFNKIQKEEVSEIMYNDTETGKVYYMSIENLKELVLSKSAFEKSFRGGRTIYIPKKFWKIKYTTLK